MVASGTTARAGPGCGTGRQEAKVALSLRAARKSAIAGNPPSRRVWARAGCRSGSAIYCLSPLRFRSLVAVAVAADEVSLAWVAVALDVAVARQRRTVVTQLEQGLR